jgi:uncharacterized phage infection (PIP) family protein YhgE
MNGDRNMNQFTYGKAILGSEHNIAQRQDIEQYKSQIDRQCVEMQAALDLLKATVETLHMRLKPVMADAPIRTANTELSPVASPLGISINQYRQQTTAVIDELAHIIESLEV